MTTIMRRALLTFAVLAMTLLGVVGTAASATAHPAAAHSPAIAQVTAVGTVASSAPFVPAGLSPVVATMSVSASEIDEVAAWKRNYLPVQRWAGATGSFHSRVDTSLLSTDIFGRVQRDVIAGLLMTVGDTIWSATSGLTTIAIDLNLYDMVGSAIDHGAASIGRALFGIGGGVSPILLLLVVAGLYALWEGRRGGGSRALKAIGTKLAVIGLMFAMMIGAAASTGEKEGFRPGVMSPGWLLTKTEDVISTVAAAPAAALSIPTDNLTSPASTDPYSCTTYINYLRSTYSERVGGGDTFGITNPVAVIPLTMSSLWEVTALEAWDASQFGTENSYGDRVNCRLLEYYSGTTPALHAYFTEQAAMSVGRTIDADRRSLAFSWGSNNEEDISLVAWASCSGSDVRRDAIVNPDQGGDDSNPACGEWWGAAAADEEVDWNKSWFDWEADQSFILDRAGDGELDDAQEDFLLSLHGNKPGSSGPASLAYLVSAISVGIVFGLLSVGIIIAKVALLGLALAMMVALLFSLLPTANTGEKMMQLGKQALGYMVIAAGAVLVFSFVAFLTDVVQTVGTEMFGRGSIMQMIWVGFSPIAAAVVMNLIFKKVLKAPSPFKPTSALAYGAAAGGIGGAAAGAMAGGMFSRAGRQLSRTASSAAGNAIADRLPPGLRGTRKGQMDPGFNGGGRKDLRSTSEAGAGATTHGRRRALGGAAGEGASMDPNGVVPMPGLSASGERTARADALRAEQAARKQAEFDATHSVREFERTAEDGQPHLQSIVEPKADAKSLRQQQHDQAEALRAEANPSSYQAALLRRRDGTAKDSSGALIPQRTGLAGDIANRVGAARAAGVSSAKDAALLAKARAKAALDDAAHDPLGAAGKTMGAVGRTGAKVAGVTLGVAAAGALGPAALPAMAAYAAIRRGAAGAVIGAPGALLDRRAGGVRDQDVLQRHQAEVEAEAARQAAAAAAALEAQPQAQPQAVAGQTEPQAEAITQGEQRSVAQSGPRLDVEPVSPTEPDAAASAPTGAAPVGPARRSIIDVPESPADRPGTRGAPAEPGQGARMDDTTVLSDAPTQEFGYATVPPATRLPDHAGAAQGRVPAPSDAVPPAPSGADVPPPVRHEQPASPLGAADVPPPVRPEQPTPPLGAADVPPPGSTASPRPPL